jgi:hypothetical protein
MRLLPTNNQGGEAILAAPRPNGLLNVLRLFEVAIFYATKRPAETN